MTAPVKGQSKYWHLLLIAPILWGGNCVVGRFIGPDVSAEALNLLRWMVAAIVLLPFGSAKLFHERRAVFDDFPKLVLLSLLGVVGFNTSLYLALQEVRASQAAIGFALTPFVIILINALLERRLPSGRITFAASLSFFGVYLAFQHAFKSLPPPEMIAFGKMMALPVLFWSLYCIALSRLRLGVSALTSFLVQILIGVALQWMYVAIFGSPREVNTGLRTDTVLAVLYLGVFAAAVAFLCWQMALQRCSVNQAGVAMNGVPLSSLLLAWAFLGEALTATEIAGVVIIFLGLFISRPRAVSA